MLRANLNPTGLIYPGHLRWLLGIAEKAVDTEGLEVWLCGSDHSVFMADELAEGITEYLILNPPPSPINLSREQLEAGARLVDAAAGDALRKLAKG